MSTDVLDQADTVRGDDLYQRRLHGLDQEAEGGRHVKTFHEAYIEPACDVLGSAGTEIGWYRFARDLATFATGVRAPYTLAAKARQIRLRDWMAEYDRARLAGERKGGSPFVTITGPAGVTTGQSR